MTNMCKIYKDFNIYLVIKQQSIMPIGPQGIFLYFNYLCLKPNVPQLFYSIECVYYTWILAKKRGRVSGDLKINL